MREMTAFILSWLAGSSFFLLGYGITAWPDLLNEPFYFAQLVYVFGAVYYVVVGVPMFYTLTLFKKVESYKFLLTGFIGSLPLALLFFEYKDLTMVTTCIIAGLVSGIIFTKVLVKNEYT
jgi:hypothetical protein